MSADLLGGDVFAPQSLNRYSYVTGNPVNLFDPLGLCGIVTSTQTEVSPNKVTTKHPTTITDEGTCSGNGNSTSGGCGGPCGGGPGNGGGSGGGGRTPNKITCSTVLPDGSTVGDVVNSVLENIGQNSVDQDSTSIAEAQTGLWDPGTVALEVYSGTNFKIMFKGQGDAGFLGDAGNFAYGAVSADLGVPLSATEFAAGVYARKSGHTDTNHPYGMDDSANRQVPAGYQATCQKH